MSFRKVVSTIVSLAVVGAAGYGAFLTQDRWVPHVFPRRPPSPPTRTAGTATMPGTTTTPATTTETA